MRVNLPCRNRQVPTLLRLRRTRDRRSLPLKSEASTRSGNDKDSFRQKISVQTLGQDWAIVTKLFRLLPEITLWSHLLGGLRTRVQTAPTKGDAAASCGARSTHRSSNSGDNGVWRRGRRCSHARGRF